LIFNETSAKTAQNVEDAFLQTAKLIYDKVKTGNSDLEPTQPGNKVTPADPNTKQNNESCC